MGDGKDRGGASALPARDGVGPYRDDEIVGSGGRTLQRRIPKPGTLVAAKRRRFLDVLAATANVRRAADAGDATPGAFYRLRSRDPSFAAQWQAAFDTALVRLEGDLLAQALGEERGAGVEGEGIDGDGTEEIAPLDPKLALDVLKRFDAKAREHRSPAVAARREVSIEEVGRVLVRRLAALGRGGAA